jgi:hypothetical protein
MRRARALLCYVQTMCCKKVWRGQSGLIARGIFWCLPLRSCCTATAAPCDYRRLLAAAVPPCARVRLRLRGRRNRSLQPGNAQPESYRTRGPRMAKRRDEAADTVSRGFISNTDREASFCLTEASQHLRSSHPFVPPPPPHTPVLCGGLGGAAPRWTSARFWTWTLRFG